VAARTGVVAVAAVAVAAVTVAATVAAAEADRIPPLRWMIIGEGDEAEREGADLIRLPVAGLRIPHVAGAEATVVGPDPHILRHGRILHPAEVAA